MLRKLFFVSIMLLALMVVGCSSKETSSSVSQKKSPIKIGVLPIEDNLPFYVAESDNQFKAAGLDVELVPFASAQERDAALQAGQIDGEVADLVAVGLLKKGGTDVKVASIGLGAKPIEGRFAILAAPNSKIKTAADLKNIPIAISQNTIIEYVTDQLLKEAGIAAGDIKKIAIPKIPIRVQMLGSGQIKAAVLPDPMATLAEKTGSKVILDDTKITTNLTQTVILFRQETIDTNKDAVKKVIEVYGQAGKSLTENPDKYRSLLIEKARIPEPIKNTYKSPTFSTPELPKVEDFNRVMNWMVEKKLLDKAYKYDELVDKNLL